MKCLSCHLSYIYLVLWALTYDSHTLLIMSFVCGRFLRGKIKQATLTWTPLWLAVRVCLGPLGKGTHFLTWDLCYCSYQTLTQFAHNDKVVRILLQIYCSLNSSKKNKHFLFYSCLPHHLFIIVPSGSSYSYFLSSNLVVFSLCNISAVTMCDCQQDKVWFWYFFYCVLKFFNTSINQAIQRQRTCVGESI